MNEHPTTAARSPWNKGRLTGQKALLCLNEIYAIRVRLQLAHRTRDLALFNLATKLRGCNLVTLRVQDVTHGTQVASRAVVMQQKSKRPVQFEITEQTRMSLTEWIALSSRDRLKPDWWLVAVACRLRLNGDGPQAEVFVGAIQPPGSYGIRDAEGEL